jgi:hypothetical protein
MGKEGPITKLKCDLVSGAWPKLFINAMKREAVSSILFINMDLVYH